MQGELFDFGLGDRLAAVRDRLRAAVGELPPATRREPIETLVKSIISSRTRDAVSLKAYEKLRRLHPSWQAMMLASPGEIAAAIGDVTYPDEKAHNLLLALRHVHVRHPDFDLHFLDSEPLPKAMAWLMALPGAREKVAAAALNFSTSRRSVFVMDTHVLRVLARLGIIGTRAAAANAHALVMSALHTWPPVELADLHSYIKLLGQTICGANIVRCRHCPVFDLCPSSTA